ncbi:Cell division cycle protein 48-like protein, partial [Stegodyphus mimosarum]
MFHIHSIIICETFNENNVFGRLSRSAVVEIREISTVEQIKQTNKFSNFVLGGAKHIMELLELNLLISKQNFSRRILMTGPSGCGKSTIVKKFCCDNNSFCILIDGIKVCNLSVENTTKYYKSIIYSLKTFPKRPCILFIDHIEQFASSRKSQFHKNLKSVSGVVYLIEHLKFSNVLIIAAAVHKNFLHSSVAELFQEEIACGMPSFEERKEILEVLTECVPDKQIDYDEVAAMTPGFIARDLTLLVKEAVMRKKNKCAQNANLETLSTKDFIAATISLSPSVLKVSQWNLKVKPIHWKDIGGMKKIKERLQM